MHIGSSISHYKIVEKLGEGGMGVVYKAEDTKLERTVALKFLADHLLSDAEAKERFLREAKAAAALHHPNVCPVHEIDEVDGKTFISMAFLKGETLEDRIAMGPLPIKDALDIARQVAEGLQAAHAEGIVHRDIKPANIIVSPEDRPTIMDFGLARLTEASRLTKVDTAMGTVAYMSPEQGQGVEVDSRTDIWALGCVLYEMVSGQRPFLGQYDQALLYEIVHEEVAPLTGLRTGIPVELELLVSKCLAKDREDRYQSSTEIAVDLRTLAEKLKSGRSTILRTSQMTGAIPATMTAAHTLNPAATLPPDAVVIKRSSQRALQALAAVATLAMLAFAFLYFTQATEPVERSVARFSFSATERIEGAIISPDGKHVAYVAGDAENRSLWVRSIANELAREVPGTEGVVRGPFWSPDSSIIGFGTTTELKTASLDGGDLTTLCELPGQGSTYPFLGGTWSPDGQRIVFSSGLLLYELTALGGDPKLLFEPDSSGRRFVYGPHFLPTDDGSDALVYTAGAGRPDRMVAIMDLETGERRELVPGFFPVYSREGYLLYGPPDDADVGVRALPFSLDTLSATGDPFPIDAASRYVSVSRDGTLAYLDRAGSAAIQTLAWRNRAGEILETVGQPQKDMLRPALSPDGTRVAVASNESGNWDVWVHDLIRSTKTRLTFEQGAETWPAWSPSGREIVYRTASGLLRKAADGTGEAVVLVEAEGAFSPEWSRDGRYLVYFEFDQETRRDIRYVELQADGDTGEPITFLSTSAEERFPRLSPDGRFLAYESDESGRPEIYVRPFPDGAGMWQVSVNGGLYPRWRSDGSELFYLEGTTLTAVSVSSGEGFMQGQPQALFGSFYLAGAPMYDVSADGQRFVTISSVEDDVLAAEVPSIRIVQNWYEEFRDREQ